MKICRKYDFNAAFVGLFHHDEEASRIFHDLLRNTLFCYVLSFNMILGYNAKIVKLPYEPTKDYVRSFLFFVIKKSTFPLNGS